MKPVHISNKSIHTLPVIQKHYPHAMNLDVLTDKLFEIYESELGMHPKQIIHADSICSDDVNNIEYPKHARLMLGPFNLGGLCGFPFAGVTGIGAFAHHVPEDGAVLIYYGPHIGLSKNGELGQILRVGQHKHTSCCGAAIVALQKLMEGNIIENEITELDYQQNIIEQILLKNEKRIKSSHNHLFEATEVLFEAIENRINELITKTDYPCEYIIQVGGIIINSDFDAGSFFECRTFKIKETKSNYFKNIIHLINN